MEKWCSRCESGLGRETAKYCYRCGLLLVDMKITCCCGKNLHNEDRFCPDCGDLTERGEREGLVAPESGNAVQDVGPRYEQANVEAWR